jgi:hypothetical protein
MRRALIALSLLLSACGGTVGPDEPCTDACHVPAVSCTAYPNGECPKVPA